MRTTIYATHGRGDHFFGVNTIRERFPDARFVASGEVITIMRQQASSAVLDSFWNSRFPGQIDANLAIAEQLAGMVIELDGETRQYIRDFDRIAADTRTARDLYNEMLALYPDRVNPGALWSSARGVKG